MNVGDTVRLIAWPATTGVIVAIEDDGTLVVELPGGMRCEWGAKDVERC